MNVDTYRTGRNRRKYIGQERDIPPFRTSMKSAKFVSSTAKPLQSQPGTSAASAHEAEPPTTTGSRGVQPGDASDTTMV